MGMTDSGEFVNEVPSTHYLFLQYGILSPFGITYAKPIVGGMFKVMARLVDKAELDKLMDMAEITMAEEAEQMQAIAKANAPKEGMHTALGDCDCSQGDSPSTKKAIKVSMKKIDEEYEKVEVGVKKRAGETHTLHRRNPGHKTEYHTITTERDGRKSVKTGSPKYIKKHWDKMEEEQIDEVSLAKAAKTARLRNIGAERSAHASPYDYSPHIDVQRRKAGKTVDRIGLKHGDDKAKKVSDKMSKDTDKVWRGKMEEDKDPCWKGYEMIGMKKKSGKPVPNCVPVKEEEDNVTHFVPKPPKRKVKVVGGNKEEMDQQHKKLMTYHKARRKNMKEEQVEEATDKDRDLSKLASAAMSKGQAVKKLPAGRAQNAVLPKGMAKGANIEKGRWSGHGKFDEETLDEVSKRLLGRYIKKAHVSGLEAASQGEIAYANKDKAGLRAANKTGEKREQGIERAVSKLAREETIAEKAPPGAKFERMVKHIKKGYAKDGELTAKEKGIAFATAWKAKNREKGE
jgi:hypothetical protein